MMTCLGLRLGLSLPSLSKSLLLSRGLRGLAPNAYRQERVVETEDGSMLVCWHPEPKFDYDMTKPMPVASQTESKLKVQAVKDMEDLYFHKPEPLQRRDLMRLTWTTKHKWLQKLNRAPFFKTEQSLKFNSLARRRSRERPFL